MSEFTYKDLIDLCQQDRRLVNDALATDRARSPAHTERLRRRVRMLSAIETALFRLEGLDK